MQIFAFGDSITYGSWDSQGGWASRLKSYIYSYMKANPTKRIELYNLGIPGNRTDHLVKRFEFEVNQRIQKDDEHIFLFAYGTNDATFVPSANSFKVSQDEFTKNLTAVIEQTKEFSSNIAILTITPVDESITVTAKPDKVRKNEFIDKYNSIIKRLAGEEGIELIDINHIFGERAHELLLCDDGLHPNDMGHEIIFEQVKYYAENKF